ncbi:hypothetical protein KC675_03560 [Candidatus Dojkabacteria bacterium]|uniref:Uncharacterized protein n=1 Tax=Candidatus Dojkabacteria bacterium TaxID=2099670 RepID=A0A955I988_9BACT|nr:hypothetical protein [Candidatus Dojkabacteria bacterium]
MDKLPQTIKRSNKDELLMYVLLFVGVSAIVLLFLVNILLIDKIMENTIKENFYLKQDLENHQIMEEKNNKTPTTEIPVEIMIEESDINSEPTE